MLSIEQVYSNVVFGIAYGYPECCITHFHVRQVDGTLFNNPNPKLLGSGYVCCNKCNNTLSEKEMEAGINRRRIISEEFSKENSPEIDDSLLEGLAQKEETIKMVINIYEMMKDIECKN